MNGPSCVKGCITHLGIWCRLMCIEIWTDLGIGVKLVAFGTANEGLGMRMKLQDVENPSNVQQDAGNK